MKTRLTVLVLFSVFLLASCKEDSNPVSPPENTEKLVLNEKAKVFNDNDFNTYVQSFSKDSTQIVFDASVKNKYSFKPGDIIISTEGRGYIAKVTGIQDSGNVVTVNITDGSVCEAFKQAHLQFNKSLDFTQEGVEYKLRKGVKLISVKTVKRRSKIDNTKDINSSESTFDILLYDLDGNPDTENDQIKLTLNLILSPTISGDIIIENSDIKKMLIEYQFEEELELSLNVPLGAISGELDKSLKKSLGEIVFPTFTLGAIPVTITPALELNLGTELKLSSVLTMGATQSYTYTFTMNYLGNNQWETSEEHTTDFGYNEPTITAGLEAEAYLKPLFLLKIYQSLSPYLFAKLYTKFEAKTDMEPWWRLFAGLDAGAGIKMKVWNFTLFDFQTNLVSLEKQIAQAESEKSDYITVTNPSSITVWHRGESDVPIEWSKGNVSGNVKIELYNVDDLYTVINNSTPNDGNYSDWDVPENMTTGHGFKVKITSLEDPDNYDFSPAFEISSEGNNLPPYIASEPFPVNFSEEQSIYTTLTWQCSDPDNDPLTYKVYFGTNDSPSYRTTITSSNYFPGKLQPNTTYFWRVDAVDNHGHTTEGLLWQFTTGNAGDNGILFYYVNAGNFIYGENNETRTIDYDYQIGEYEITNIQYANFLNEMWINGEISLASDSNSVDGYYEGDENFPPGIYAYYVLRVNDGRIALVNNHFVVQNGYANHPVNYVTWFGAHAFAQHYGLSLPTEEEWEKAARGMIGGVYPWGNGNISGNIANYLNSGDPWDNGTTPIGYYSGANGNANNASPYSAFDMAGNVAEWTNSFYLSYDANRVIRGGSWNDNPEDLKTYQRIRKDPLDGSPYIGFRCTKGSPNANRPPNKPHDPIPEDGSYTMSNVITLKWECEDPDNDPLTYDVYIGTTENPSLIVSGISENSYFPDTLDADQTFYWKIVVHDNYGHTVEGDVWKFSTTCSTGNHSPNQASSPYPPDESSNIPLDIQLSWNCSDPDDDPITYDVYFGTEINPPLIAQNVSEKSYTLPHLQPFTSYRWKIDARDSKGALTTGIEWHFTTGDSGTVNFEWIEIPAGDFTFGEGDTIKNIPYDYKIMKYEVTNKQYAEFLNSALADGLIDLNTKGHYEGDLGYPEGDYYYYQGSEIQWNIDDKLFYITEGKEDIPVVDVTYFGAHAFAKYYGLEIPTEEEWEKAARGNTGYDYPWGDSPPTCGQANIQGCNGQLIDVGQTTGLSPYGCYDMIGNAKEWVNTYWVGDWNYRKTKGGCYLNGGTDLPAWRHGVRESGNEYFGLGFRCIKK